MGEEIVTVHAGGRIFPAWKSVRVTAGADQAARSFRLVAAAETGAAALFWTFAPGRQVEISANGDLLLAGYVDAIAPALKASEVTITGRSRSCDLVDCAALDETGWFEGRTPEEIGQALDAFGVGISSAAPLRAVDYQLTPGETVHAAVEKLCRDQGVTPCGQADGSMRLLGPPAEKHAGGLFEGGNLLDLRARHDFSRRYSETIARGQRPIGHGAANLELQMTARDSALARYRPTLLIVDDDTDAGRLKTRAEQRRDRAAGQALKALASVQGFRDHAGRLFEPGWLIWTESAFCRIAQNMMIERVTYLQDDRSGSIANIDLVDPRAYGGKPGRGSRSGREWSIDDSDAE